MSLIIFLIIVDTLVQVKVCGFSLWWIICVVARILFCTRVIGVTFKVKKLAIAEGSAIGCMLIWNILFASKNFPWQRLLFFAAFVGVAIGLMLLDNMLYVYVVEDVDEE